MATPGMSKPRAATSVATSTPRSPLELPEVRPRNCSRASSRTHCSLPLWIVRHQTPKPARCSSLVISSHLHFMLAKTIAVSPLWSSDLMRSFNCAGFSSSCITLTTCLTLAFAVSLSPPAPWPMRTCTADVEVRLAAVCCTSFGQVAVKKSVCRRVPATGPVAPPPSSGFPVLGHCSTILRMSASKPMSSMRSASSSTKCLTFSMVMTPRPRKSSKRPGVQMTISQPSAICFNCGIASAPP
mmetsp:Transcript_75833/g.209281  ORF Transcript_75833/g.209281 Transcript_75833/m.209281 type:complete len:241 (-) Transcript_75833:612-1334(-)